MKIDEFEFQDKNGNEIEPSKSQLVIYIKFLHKQIAELQKQLGLVKKAFELARKEELREIGIYDDDLDYDKEMLALEREYSEQAVKEIKGGITMEEKERYKLESHNGTFCEFHDTETDKWYTRKDLVTDLLNQQDKRIKELEEENNFLEKRNEELIIDRRDLCLERNDIFEENQQLKQTQEQQVREKVVGDIRNQLKNMDFLASDWELGERCTCYSKYKVLDILLKVEKDQVKGENNVKD